MSKKNYIIELNNIKSIEDLLQNIKQCTKSVMLVGEGLYLNLDSSLSQIFAKAILKENQPNSYYLEVFDEKDNCLLNSYIAKQGILV